MNHHLPELDRRKTQQAIEALFEKYRIYKTITFEARETDLTALYGDRSQGPTNGTSEQTAQAENTNMDVPAARKQYCDTIDLMVERLSEREQRLIRERYLKQDDVYDYKVYNHMLEPPVSKDTYAKIRSRAFYKLALAFADRGMLHLEKLRKGSKAKGNGRAMS
ncbi:phage transcriptional regulator, ArpU family [Paenibacillus algicola]|uniref:Phage transcriptional regulator, ArpU family n=1 Tax=Paenibacillus algicola TaxID=2565926 RepID=A0A4P8XQU1_9BACL|nr:ArpU family phage packaging/lysis transcriptional regulator [Paenibacillus algicola]QCT04111.1 phage transcriptional regulator, ArpU family [Paenibacillus algicola]